MRIEKIALVSDLHLDNWHRYYGYRSESSPLNLMEMVLEKCVALNPDIIVIPGDAGNGFKDTEFMKEYKGIPIFYVPGNHDYYGTDWEVFLTHNPEMDMVGATLWTNFNGKLWGEAEVIYRNISDYYHINGVTTNKVIDTHHHSWEYILHTNSDIVVTHFPAFQQSINEEKFKGDPVNPYFVNDRENDWLAVSPRATLWLHGHVHHTHHYYIGDMLVACHPLGYPKENYRNVKDYEPMLIRRDNPDGNWEIN